MKTQENKDENNEDIIYDENVENSKGVEVVKKLRARLRKCEKEKKEYLDGWQRLKADNLNAKKQQIETLKNTKRMVISDFVHSLLPALDSFDIALQGSSWESVDKVWRIGIEHVHAQLLKSLEDNGVESFGKVGDIFDANIHEAISHEDKKNCKDGTISKVERKGYKIGDTIIRPAHVVVYN